MSVPLDNAAQTGESLTVSAWGGDRICVTFDKGDLSRVRWVFWPRNNVLHLDEYTVMERPSRRHNYRTGLTWSRLRDRDNTINFATVPKPDAVAEKARQFWAAQLSVAWEYTR